MEKSFNERCYELLKRVPKGKVVSYKSLAEALNSRAYRAVGNAMNHNQNAPVIPCHRVINSNGKLGGYAFGINKKISILKSEGIEIKNGKVDLEKYEYKFNSVK